MRSHYVEVNYLNTIGEAQVSISKAIRPSLWLTFFIISAFLQSSDNARAQSSALVATPPMGWSSWNHFGGKVNDADIRAAADTMVANGMRDAGYVYINIDDGWQGERDANGNIRANQKFPDMGALAAYVHSKGLKLGIYSSPGPKTCGGYAGSYGHEEQDAKTFATWGMDYLKYDLCSYESIMDMWDTKHPDEPLAAMRIDKATAMMEDAYRKMHRALLGTHRTIVYSICQYGIGDVWTWGPSAGGNLWRTTDDIRDDYRSMSLIGFSQAGLERFAGPGHWNDPDMLEIGNGGMTPDEYRTQMSLWAMLAAPLLAGNDLTRMDTTTKSILMNKDVIAVDQDRLGVQGRRIGPLQIWMKPLSGGAKAVAIFNTVIDDQAIPITLRLKDVGFTGAVNARDLWAHKDLGVIGGSYTVVPPPGGVVMLRLWNGVPETPVSGEDRR
ncbi:MAG TPA: glycoside hydrolase family 27 protein [Acidobacteriaceae bacterium]|nr:glycoside hydrolase family 27 protein [Acidobacteriaceae bacterium]